MSTYWRFRCLSHDPPLVSEEEFTQHTEDASFWNGLALAIRRTEWIEIERAAGERWDFDWNDDYFARNARRFLRNHPFCKIDLLNEYGESRNLDVEGAGDE